MRHRLSFLALVVAVSVLVPGLAHLRLGAVANGLAYLLLTAAVSAVQFGAPFFVTASQAAVAVSAAFALGWVLSALAARSAAQLALAPVRG